MPRGAACLGWDTTEYVDLVPGCARDAAWAFVYAPQPPGAARGLVRLHRHKRVLAADVGALAEGSTLGEARAKFDLIVCQQVFEHVDKPAEGIRALHNLLKPGVAAAPRA